MTFSINPLNAKLNPICQLLALLGAHHILHVSWIRVNCLVSATHCTAVHLFIWWNDSFSMGCSVVLFLKILSQESEVRSRDMCHSWFRNFASTNIYSVSRSGYYANRFICGASSFSYRANLIISDWSWLIFDEVSMTAIVWVVEWFC
jgi:hypothetical protein